MFPGSMPPPNRAEVETEAGAVAAPGWTADERERIAVELATKLPPEAIASRPGQSGKEFSYMEFWRVVERSNQILGFDGWSSTIVDMNQEYMETRDGRTSCGYTVVVRVTLKCGTFHEDVGFGSMEKQTDRGKAIENAKKEAVSDATKRALKSFGHALGLSIYDTAHVQQLKRDGASKRARTATAGGADALRSADGPLPGLPLDPSLAAGCSNACGPPPQAVQHPQRTTGSHAAPGVAPSSTAPAQGAWQPRAMHASACGVASAPSCSASVHAQHASAQVSRAQQQPQPQQQQQPPQPQLQQQPQHAFDRQPAQGGGGGGGGGCACHAPHDGGAPPSCSPPLAAGGAGAPVSLAPQQVQQPQVQMQPQYGLQVCRQPQQQQQQQLGMSGAGATFGGGVQSMCQRPNLVPAPHQQQQQLGGWARTSPTSGHAPCAPKAIGAVAGGARAATPQVHAAHGPSCAPPVAQASFQHTQPLGNLTNINVTTANPSGSPHALPSEPPSLGVEPAANHVEAIQRGWHAPRKV